ncbi:hypothetical protein QAD02_002905 [Eretmocerus hayati]|uniref:Uncharacterized protein n=1 Tax=Eretmocerus hayati TaxID=131215 RepID=A0ACC2NKM0_9HYME|nr:hypothetical protein QAD02_002905 [Eretmocerus hayati]
MNARTGEGGGISIMNEERSRDKIKTAEGQRMLKILDSLGQTILNGNIKGDEEGNYTYIGAKGNTVIYHAIGNTGGLEKIEEMKIKEKTKSDHLPLEITLKIDKEDLTQKKKTIQI